MYVHVHVRECHSHVLLDMLFIHVYMYGDSEGECV